MICQVQILYLINIFSLINVELYLIFSTTHREVVFEVERNLEAVILKILVYHQWRISQKCFCYWNCVCWYYVPLVWIMKKYIWSMNLAIPLFAHFVVCLYVIGFLIPPDTYLFE